MLAQLIKLCQYHSLVYYFQFIVHNRLTSRRYISGEVIANFFVDRGCHVVSMTDPYGRILGFLDRSRYFSIK
jgi:hypothetical protein